MARRQVIIQFKGDTGFHASRIIRADTQFHRKAIHRAKGSL